MKDRKMIFLAAAFVFGFLLSKKIRDFFKKPYNFQDKKVLITGGAHGIGKLLAIALAQKGCHVIIWDIQDEWGKKVVEEIESISKIAKFFKVDLCNPQEVNRVAQLTISEVGFIDLVINNAGVVSGKKILDLSDAEIQRTFSVNILAHFWVVKNFLPSMIARNEGYIVTIASSAGLVGIPRLTDYCSTKFAAIGFNESLRRELQTENANIHTTCVCPYHINTGMFHGIKQTSMFGLVRSLEPEHVRDEIISAITWKKQVVVLPTLVHLGPLTKSLLPAYLVDLVFRITGLSSFMDDFKGTLAGDQRVK
eukprot:c14933_g1_i1.p1 GENE.c14933_g1_i1~~c14933_g1_i1.p1  ORF type:complete len:317 (+),score=123.98 c14933_g1_i1:28-951(+)